MSNRARSLAVRAFGVAFALVAPLVVTKEARAYPWMIRHGYTSCQPCHADPSGAGALTEYGRAQGDILLRSRYGANADEPSNTSKFLFGIAPVPEGVRLGGDVRAALLRVKPEGAPAMSRAILMRADGYADVVLGRLRIAGGLGFVPTGSFGSALTRSPSDNLVSREHWIGVEIGGEHEWLLRAGRIARPFGLRSIEHTLWVRNLTRSDLDDDQQHGVALAWSREAVRAEVMAIAGNFQLRPDAYRERGYSAYVEVAPTSRLAIGLSSQITRAERDMTFHVMTYRHANGIFARYSPWGPLVLLAEADSVYQSLTWNGHRGGFATMLQADLECVQGVHVGLTGEAKNGGASGEAPSFGGWLTALWFFAPHADVRVDGILQRFGSVGPSSSALTLLAQLHAYL